MHCLLCGKQARVRCAHRCLSDDTERTFCGSEHAELYHALMSTTGAPAVARVGPKRKGDENFVDGDDDSGSGGDKDGHEPPAKANKQSEENAAGAVALQNAAGWERLPKELRFKILTSQPLPLFVLMRKLVSMRIGDEPVLRSEAFWEWFCTQRPGTLEFFGGSRRRVLRTWQEQGRLLLGGLPLAVRPEWYGRTDEAGYQKSLEDDSFVRIYPREADERRFPYLDVIYEQNQPLVCRMYHPDRMDARRAVVFHSERYEFRPH